jgi:hypothetical protein
MYANATINQMEKRKKRVGENYQFKSGNENNASGQIRAAGFMIFTLNCAMNM